MNSVQNTIRTSEKKIMPMHFVLFLIVDRRIIFNTFPRITMILIPKQHKDPQQRNFRPICFMSSDIEIFN